MRPTCRCTNFTESVVSFRSSIMNLKNCSVSHCCSVRRAILHQFRPVRRDPFSICFTPVRRIVAHQFWCLRGLVLHSCPIRSSTCCASILMSPWACSAFMSNPSVDLFCINVAPSVEPFCIIFMRLSSCSALIERDSPSYPLSIIMKLWCRSISILLHLFPCSASSVPSQLSVSATMLLHLSACSAPRFLHLSACPVCSRLALLRQFPLGRPLRLLPLDQFMLPLLRPLHFSIVMVRCFRQHCARHVRIFNTVPGNSLACAPLESPGSPPVWQLRISIIPSLAVVFVLWSTVPRDVTQFAVIETFLIPLYSIDISCIFFFVIAVHTADVQTCERLPTGLLNFGDRMGNHNFPGGLVIFIQFVQPQQSHRRLWNTSRQRRSYGDDRVFYKFCHYVFSSFFPLRARVLQVIHIFRGLRVHVLILHSGHPSYSSFTAVDVKSILHLKSMQIRHAVTNLRDFWSSALGQHAVQVCHALRFVHFHELRVLVVDWLDSVNFVYFCYLQHFYHVTAHPRHVCGHLARQVLQFFLLSPWIFRCSRNFYIQLLLFAVWILRLVSWRGALDVAVSANAVAAARGSSFDPCFRSYRQTLAATSRRKSSSIASLLCQSLVLRVD